MYDNNNRGAIWRNEDKQKDTHPDFKGTATIDGVEYYVNAWKRTSDNPKAPALSFQVVRQDEVKKKALDKANQTASTPTPPDMDGFDDDIPF